MCIWIWGRGYVWCCNISFPTVGETFRNIFFSKSVLNLTFEVYIVCIMTGRVVCSTVVTTYQVGGWPIFSWLTCHDIQWHILRGEGGRVEGVIIGWACHALLAAASLCVAEESCTGASLVVKKAEIVFIADDILRYILPECKFSLITILHIINPIQTELTSDMQLNNIYKLILDWIKYQLYGWTKEDVNFVSFILIV